MRYYLPQIVGITFLALSVPLLIWQATPGNQLPIAPPQFVALHSMMETFAIVVAALIFFTGFGAHETRRSLRSLVLGYAFLAVALFDMFHFLSYIGMPDLLSANTPHKAILFWLLARAAAGAGLLAYILIPEKPAISNTARRTWAMVVVVAAMALSYVFLQSPHSAPLMFAPEQGLTPLKIALEWGMFVFYLSTAGLLYLRRKVVTNCDIESLLLALLLMAAGELFFTLYVQVTNTANLIGHVYKVLAYYFLYRAIFSEAVQQPFRQMEKMLTHDDLTGLPNRIAFNDRLSLALAWSKHSNTPCAVILLDLDQFKNVNDTLGHELGDLLLVSVAGRLHAQLPPSAFLARFSSDEFVILFEGAGVERAKEAAATLLQSMNASFDLGVDRLEIGASLGLVTYPTDGDSASVLMRHADMALHRAKANGRNCITVFSSDLSEEMQRRVLIEGRMKHALERGEFSLAYQPKVDIASGRIVGWEALLRWNSAELGCVSPVEFIPVAEQSGLILRIGDWVLREACRQVQAWHASGLPQTKVAVNLSTRQFRQHDLVQRIQSALLETGLSAQHLELEITESAIMDNLVTAAAALTELSRIGITIAIDDFGTGHSSLSYLKTFDIHCIKIDRSFVRDLPHDAQDMAIVRTVLALAESLGLVVVAEGVETEEQFAYLRDNRCHQLQGFLFSRPLAPEACVELMRSGKSMASLPALG
jgi:diguanylate cyclase (GGDEF)-like protein